MGEHRYLQKTTDEYLARWGPGGRMWKPLPNLLNSLCCAVCATGAYTPICHRQHLPGIIALSDELRSPRPVAAPHPSKPLPQRM